ncbi:hypothetical protein Hanom_Chr00s000007g01615691 [Helianthus anomalus]
MLKGLRRARSLTASLICLKKKKLKLLLLEKKNHKEALARIAELEKTVEKQQTQSKTLELLSQDLGDDCKWLLTHGVPLIAGRLVKSEELAKYMFELGGGCL